MTGSRIERVFIPDGTVVPAEHDAAHSDTYALLGNSGAAKTIDPDDGTIQRLTLNANCTITMATTSTVRTLILDLVQDATGSRTVTWDADINWPNDVAPALSATAGHRDRVQLVTHDGGATYDAVHVGTYI